MSAHCVTCTCDRVTDLVASLRAATLQRSFLILPGDRVRENAAASLLNRKTSTLEKWRYTDERLPYCKDRAGRVTYALRDIAAFILGDDPEKVG